MLTLILSVVLSQNLNELIYAPTHTVTKCEFNTTGWEDSFSISPDGKSCDFTYFPFDTELAKQGKWRLSGPMGTPERPYPQNIPSSIIYRADIVGGKLANIKYSPFTDLRGLDGCQHYGPTEIWWHREKDGKRTICAGKYNSRTYTSLFPEYDNPFVDETTNQILFMESKLTPDRDIFMAVRYPTRFGDKWVGPENMNKRIQINTAQDEIQPCYRFNKLYFTRAYRQILYADFTTNKVVEVIGIIPTATNIISMGEPTVDVNGNLYFVVAFRVEGGFDCDVCVMKKK